MPTSQTGNTSQHVNTEDASASSSHAKTAEEASATSARAETKEGAPKHSQHAKRKDCSPVRYMDLGALAQPLDLPRNQYKFLAIFVAIAIVIGAIMVQSFVNGAFGEAKKTNEEIQTILAQETNLELPTLAKYTINNAKGVKTRFDKAGISYYDNSDNSDYDLELISIPENMTSEEVETIVTEGTSSVDTVTAVRYLCGSWILTGDYSNGIDYRIKFCDMTSTSASAAIESAAATQNYNLEKAGDETEDSVGNTSVSGTTKFDGNTYNWTVSACLLSDVYSIDGLPDGAQYVGIRLTS